MNWILTSARRINTASGLIEIPLHDKEAAENSPSLSHAPSHQPLYLAFSSHCAFRE